MDWKKEAVDTLRQTNEQGGNNMKNYISINNQRIELTDEQVEKIRASFVSNGVKLSDVAEGDTFTIREHEFVVLEQSGDTTAVVLKGLLSDRREFGKNNNYNGSNVDEDCIKFAAEIAAIVGEENLVEHTVDLTSDDGLDDYGQIKRRASLLTADRYRRYVKILDKHKLDKWWWLATAYSTPTHENETWVKCVAPSGVIDGDNCIGGDGVRPFCILKSNIFVSD